MYPHRRHQGKLGSRYPAITVLGQGLWGASPKMFLGNTVPGSGRETWPQHNWVSLLLIPHRAAVSSTVRKNRRLSPVQAEPPECTTRGLKLSEGLSG